jgi:prolycopene isomerase
VPDASSRLRFHGEASRDAYDAIVVGSGIGGLATAALLARAGQDVLVVERHDRVGGYAHAFRRGRHLFDSAVHMVGGCEPVAFEGGGLIHRLLSALGVRERLDFERIDPFYDAHYPGARALARCDLDEFARSHAGGVASEEKGLRQFLSECLNARQETQRATGLTHPFGVVQRPDHFPTLLRYRRATLGRVLDAHLDRPQTKAFAATLWPYLGLPPARVSFLYFATMLMSYLADGAFYCRGSFQRLADTLAAVVTESGGEVLLRSPVRRIAVEGGRVRGIVLENGQRVEAPRVVSNADATQTVEELIGREVLPRRYVEGLGRLRPSISAFVVYAAADLELPAGTGHETFLYDSWDHEAAWRSSLEGRPSWLSVTVPTLSDPGLAPEGRQLLVLTTLVPYASASAWRAAKQPLERRLLELAERRFPGLGRSLCFAESATPRTMERYTRNTAGAVYGWELSPSQVGPGRPSAATPLPGLSLVGHWTHPGGGIYGVVWSALAAARGALGLASDAELWEAVAGPRRGPAD